MFKIDNNLYISNKESAYNSYLINKNNIKYCIDCTKNNYNIIQCKNIKFKSSDPPTNKDINFIFNNIKSIIKLILKINTKNINVLIFCNKGRNRSSTLAIGFLIYKYNINYITAYRYLKNINHNTLLNPSSQTIFIIQNLKNYLN